MYPPLVVVQQLRFDMRQVIAACVETFVPQEHLDHLDLELSPDWPVRGQFKSRWIGCCWVECGDEEEAEQAEEGGQ